MATAAAGNGHLNVVKYAVEEKGANNLNKIMRRAERNEYPEIVKYIESLKNSFNG